MANQGWLESTLRRLALVGLEVLERTARRGVDWAHAGPTLPTPTTDHEDGQNPLERTHRSANPDDAFETIGAFMAQTTHQCMNFHRLNHCSEYSEAERTHGSRFHTHRPPTWKQDRSLSREDFHIEVSPGSYTITAGMPHAHQQTQRVSLQAGDSITLNFDLSPSPDQLVHF